VVLYRSGARLKSLLYLLLSLAAGGTVWWWADRMLLPAIGLSLTPLFVAFFTLGEAEVLAFDPGARALIHVRGVYGWRERTVVAVDDVRELRHVEAAGEISLELRDRSGCRLVLAPGGRTESLAERLMQVLRLPLTRERREAWPA